MSKILIIENNKNVAAKASEALKICLDDADVHICRSGNDGLKRMKKRSFDLVISGSRLSDMTGFELLESINEIGGHWPVIILSSSAQSDEAVKYTRTGVYDYIVKDSNYPQTLAVAARRALDLSYVFNEKRNIVETNIERDRRRELSRMAHVLNHEINNPLMTVMGNVQLLLSKPDINPGELREKLAAIEESAQRIARVMAFFADRNNENYSDLSSHKPEQGLVLKPQ